MGRDSLRLDTKHGAIALAVFVFLLSAADVASQFVRNTWIFRDARFYTNTNVTLVEDLSLEQHRFASSWYESDLGWNVTVPTGWSNVAVGRHGEFWPKHPWLMPLLSTPFFFAFDIFGTLLFNLCVLGSLAAALWTFCRAYTRPGPAAAAVMAFLLATTLRENAYGYHVDPLITALCAGSAACLTRRSGFAAGVLYALALGMKPSAFVLAPALLLVLWERGSWRELGTTILGGAFVLIPIGLANTMMFGRPWIFGYSRELIVEAGVHKIQPTDALFARDLHEGLKDVWSGETGLSKHQTIMALAAPGLAVLLFRRPRYALGAMIATAASTYVFARYIFEGERFHWPAIALLVPALAVTFDALASGARVLVQAVARRVARRELLAPFAAAVLAVAAAATSLTVGDHPPEERIGKSAYVTGALALGRHHSLDVRAMPDAPREDVAGSVTESRVTGGRFGLHLPRAPVAAVVLAAPFAAAGGELGLLLLHLLAAGLVAFAGARVLTRLSAPAVAVAVAAGATLLPFVRDQILFGGAPLFATALALLSLDLALGRRWATSAALGVLAAWVAEAPVLVAIAPLAWAARSDLRSFLRTLGAGSLVLIAWAVTSVVLLGRPFATAEDYVLVSHGPGVLTTMSAPRPELMPYVEAALDAPTAIRGLALLAVAGLLGATIALVRRPRESLALWLLGLSAMLPGCWAPLPSILLATAVALSLAPLVDAVGTAVARLRRPATLALVGATFLLLATVGLGRRVAEARAPLRFATSRAVRAAEVELAGRNVIPCDFLNWTHMSWECATFDHGTYMMAGLAINEGINVASERRALFLIPTGSGGRMRRVTWHGVPATRDLWIRYAVPDGLPGGSHVTVRLGPALTHTFDAPAGPDGQLHDLHVDTTTVAGKSVDVVFEVTSTRPTATSAVAIDGGFI